MSRKVLVFCEGIWLAHTVRPLSVARRMREAGWDVHFGASGKYASLPESEGFPVHDVATMDPARALELIRSARIGYNRRIIDLYVEDETTLIDRLKPDVILNDFRLPVAISARTAGVPFVNILNAYWTNYYAPRLRAPEDFPLTRLLGKRLTTRLLPPVAKMMFALYARPFNTAAKRRGLPALGNIFDVMASPHLNLIADLERFMPLAGAPENFKHIGPIPWEPSAPPPQWLDALDKSRPVVYFSMGSTGLSSYYRVLVDAFEGTDFQVMVTTGGARPGDLPENFFVAEFAPGVTLAARSDLVICHGGNGTIYQALAGGVPVLGIPTFHDQDFNMQRVEDLGLGAALYPRTIDGAALRETARRLIDDIAVKAACEAVGAEVRAADAPAAALSLIEKLV